MKLVNTAIKYSLYLFVLSLLISCGQPKVKNVDNKDSLSIKSDNTKPISNPQSPRFVIVQSPLAAKATFKLDTYSGDVYQMVVDQVGQEKWQLLKRPLGSTKTIEYADRANYSIFLSTLAMRFTYLINIHSGASWQLAEDTQTNETFFSPLD